MNYHDFQTKIYDQNRVRPFRDQDELTQVQRFTSRDEPLYKWWCLCVHMNVQSTTQNTTGPIELKVGHTHTQDTFSILL